jgi:hypothetical protein
MSLKFGLRYIVHTIGFDATFFSLSDQTSHSVKIAKANRDRKLDSVAETTYEGREFLLEKDILVGAGYNDDPRVGDRITSQLGTDSITEVVPQVLPGGEVEGWRLRVG